ncbi:MAG: hypothetical protein ACK504_07415 [Bacteroidota bacterium]
MKLKVKIIISSFLLLVVVFASTPNSYFHSLFVDNHALKHKAINNEILNDNKETQRYDFEKFDTPIYYTFFKFILNFLPINTPKKTAFVFKEKEITVTFYKISFLKTTQIV